MTALDLLTGDAQTFTEKVWASSVHLHRTDDPAALAALLSFDDVDALLTSTAIRTPSVRLARDGAVLPASTYTRGATLAGSPLTGLVDARKLLDLFAGGATVVLQGLHRYWPPLTDLVRRLELELGHPCQANAYLTPPGSQGFAVHSDTHDVFVFQTHGTKLWEVHEDGTPREVLMEPGLCLYLPTGTPHAARAQQDASLHVTLGVNQVTWRDLVTRAVARVLDDADLDRHVPAGWLEDPERLEGPLAGHLAGLAETLVALPPDRVADAEARRFLTSRAPLLHGGLADVLTVEQLSDTTVLRRRPGSALVLQDAGDRLRVLLGDRELLVPARLRAPLEHVRDHPDGFAVADLAAWLDDASRLVLTRRLVREGALTGAAG